MLGFAFAALLVSPQSASANPLLGEWQISGQRDGASYQGSARVDAQRRLTWSAARGGSTEHLSGRVQRDDAGFYLFSQLGIGQRLRRFFTRKRKVRYRGTVQQLSATSFQISLRAGSRVVGQETWTRSRATPTPAPVPTPQPVPLPTPGGLPFVHPDTFVALPGTDVWHVKFNPALFRQDMQARGLLSGEAQTDEVMLLRLKSLILQSANEKYRRSATGTALPGQSWKISFTARPPQADPRVFPGVAQPRVGRDYSRMEIGGTAGGTHGRVPRNDSGNRRREDNSGGRWGVFSGSIVGTDSTLSPALRASDRVYLDGSYLLGDGTPAQDQRFQRVQTVSANWAYALSSTLSHEVGHSVGCPHTGKTFAGRVYRAGPRLSLMRHKKNRTLLSEPATRFFSNNQRRLDQNLGLE